MQDQKTIKLTTVFSEVLANMAFMFTDEKPAEPPPGVVWIETTVAYRGSVAGTLRLWCTRDFSIRLAANLLGTHPDTDQSANDAVKEFMNVLCGQFITSTYGTEEAFSLAIPEIVKFTEKPDLTVREEVETSVVSVDGQFLQLSHTLESTPRVLASDKGRS